MKNTDDNYLVSVSGFTAEGSGVARLPDGLAVFIPGALPGEVVKISISQRRKNFAIGKMLEVIEPSAQRTPAPCPVYENCGGCLLQHASYDEQLQLKKTIISDAFKRIAKLDSIEIADVIGAKCQFAYRNRVSYHVSLGENDVQLGFYSSRSRNFVSAPDCLLAAPSITALARRLPELLQPYHSSLSALREIVIRVNTQGDQMLLTLVSDQPLSHARELAATLRMAEPKLCSVWECIGHPVYSIYGDKWQLLSGEQFLAECLCGVSLQLSPATFTQVNSQQTESLYQLVAEFASLSGQEVVWDLYSGAGIIALYLAKQASAVIGVENYSPAAANACQNAKLNGIENCRFIAGAAESVLPQLVADGFLADLVVLDPPRSGCDRVVLETLLSFMPQRIIYVSCDPATLARDLRILCDSVYTVQRVQPVDMFPQTGHVESVVLLMRIDQC